MQLASEPFNFSCRTPMVWFGRGRSGQVAARMAELNVRRALLVSTESGARRYSGVVQALGDQLVATFAGAQPHCPLEVAQAALAAYREARCDAVISVGGGSTIGLGKYIAVEAGAVHITLPTTLAGSDMTPLFGVLSEGVKRTRKDWAALPNTSIVDPELAQSLPLHETGTTGMNALAHCVEALYAPMRSPFSDRLALDGVKALASGLRRLCVAAGDLDARDAAAYGAVLGGLMVTTVGIRLHHKICHVLGGRFSAAHGEVQAPVLTQVLAFNLSAMPEAAAALAAALEGPPAHAILQLARQLGVPTSLRELGLDRARLAAVAQECLAGIDANPRPIDAATVAAILDAAWEGRLQA